MDCTSTGRHTDLSFVAEKASASIRRKNESDSIESNESDWQPLKQPEPRIPTIRGMMMEVKEEPENAFDSICRQKIRRNNEPDSNEIDECDLRSRKHSEPRTSTVRGMTMDARKEPQTALDPMTRTKCNASIRTTNRRRQTGPLNGISWQSLPRRTAQIQWYQS
jgi:hypothetical protein